MSLDGNLVPDKGHADAASQMVVELEGVGAEVTQVWFVDDLVPDAEIASMLEVMSMMQEAGFNPDLVVLESWLRFEAEAVIESMFLGEVLQEEYEAVLSRSKGPIVRPKSDKSRMIRLGGKNGDPDCPSCNLLDKVLYQVVKLGDEYLNGEVAVTVLPVVTNSYDWKKQQSGVKAMFDVVGEDYLDVVVLFVEGDKVVDFDIWQRSSHE